MIFFQLSQIFAELATFVTIIFEDIRLRVPASSETCEGRGTNLIDMMGPVSGAGKKDRRDPDVDEAQSSAARTNHSMLLNHCMNKNFSAKKA